MTLRPNTAHGSWPLRFVLFGLLLLAHLPGAMAQSVVVLVNDEPITSYDVAQRQRFLALTGGLGDKVRAKLQSEETKAAFKAYMTEQRPQSREEAQELQKKFVAKLQQDVVASSSGSKRQEAIDQLIEERLMMQEARAQKISVSDADVNESLTRMAKGGGRDASLEEFLGQFQNQGVNPSTLRERIRAQTAWREVIRRIYGSRVQAAVSRVDNTAPAEADSGTLVDVEIVKFTLPANADQNVFAKRLVEAEAIRKGFSTCPALVAQIKGKTGITVQSLRKANLKDFSGDVRAALVKAKPGEMTPPVINGGNIESHAVCTKQVSVASGKSEKKDESKDRMQEEFQLYSRRHLKDMKDRASIKYLSK
ncbi:MULTISPECIES: SurA N-terminal domain-containing protein [Rhodomicrobium]|uniref:SurA N-terminal domain-containing protein n=1 Tax=Rhodomicrobium TaxID=1068 RepID=UPI000B4A5CB4|nr:MULTISPECIES: SurA N-terminal domain-containing protein [Rhodomicrobium]